MNYRVIYMVEEYTTDGNLVTRQYARNKKTADRIARTCDKANDIIVFLPNGNEKSHYYVKRVVAVPGDTVLIKDGALYVNDKLFDEEVEVASMEDAGLAAEEITLGADEFFVLGDNRNNSEDSRYANIGNIKKEHIIGKAWFRMAKQDSELGLIE